MCDVKRPSRDLRVLVAALAVAVLVGSGLVGIARTLGAEVPSWAGFAVAALLFGEFLRRRTSDVGARDQRREYE